MVRWPVIGLIVIIGLAGCTAVPFGEPTAQKKPAPVMLVNNETQTETFTVAVAEVGSNLTITDGDGRTFNLTISQGSSGYGSSQYRTLVQVDFPETADHHGEYTLQPGERRLMNVTGVDPEEAIVVLVYDEEDEVYRAINSLSCGSAIRGYRVQSQKGGSDHWTMSSHQCSH